MTPRSATSGSKRWARARFAVLGATRNRWSGQLMEPVDALGFIGRNPRDDENVYIVTGDSGDGMTHGTIGGMLISDLVAGRVNPWERLYDPARKSVRAAGTYLGENANFVGHMVRDWVKGGEVHDRADIAPGEGAITARGTIYPSRCTGIRRENCTSSRRCAPISAAWCSGTAEKRAGTAPVTGRDSRSTARCSMDPRNHHCGQSSRRPRRPTGSERPQPRA